MYQYHVKWRQCRRRTQKTDHHGLCWSRPASCERLDLNHSHTFLLPLRADPVTSEERWGVGAGWTGRQWCVRSRSLLLTSSDSVRWLGLCQVAFGKKKVLSQMKKSCSLSQLARVSREAGLVLEGSVLVSAAPQAAPSVNWLVPSLPPSLFSGRLPPNQQLPCHP